MNEKGSGAPAAGYSGFNPGRWRRFLGRLGRAYWIERADRALSRAHEQGLIDSWTLHEIDHRIKYAQDPGTRYPARRAQ